MILTEELAKLKLCPGSIAETSSGAINQTPNVCHGSGCLAWRWMKAKGGIPEKTYGFCGLGGTPIDLDPD